MGKKSKDKQADRGSQTDSSPGHRRFLIMHIDALSYDHLLRLFKEGKMKFLKKLVKSEGYHIEKFSCGIPSATPSVQAGIIYGKNDMLPAFRFFDKEKGEYLTYDANRSSRFIESKYFKDSKSILDHGSSYLCTFLGKASDSILLMKSLYTGNYLNALTGTANWLPHLTNPFFIIPLVYNTALDLMIELIEALIYPLMFMLNKKQAIFKFWIPFKRILATSFANSIVTQAVLKGIKKGSRAIYGSYFGYDVISHYRGAHSKSAHYTLSKIDHIARRIYRKAKDKYDIFIISDHGMVDAVPFRTLNKESIHSFIERCIDPETIIENREQWQSSADNQSKKEANRAVRSDMGGVRRYPSMERIEDAKKKRSLKSLFSIILNGAVKMAYNMNPQERWKDKKGYFVTTSSPLAYIYLNKSKKRLDLSEINKAYPHLINNLMQGKGVGVIMAKDRGNLVMLNKEGTIRINDSTGKVKIKGSNFLKGYCDHDDRRYGDLVKQLRYFNSMKYVGDISLVGEYRKGIGTSFEDQVAAHGAFGGDMTYPFMISKKRYDLSKVVNAKELNGIFKEYPGI